LDGGYVGRCYAGLYGVEAASFHLDGV